MTNLTPNHYRVLEALRSSTVMQREPTIPCPSGQRRWFTLEELADDGTLAGNPLGVGPANLAALASAARGLYRQHLAARHTQFTVTRYAITDEGYLALAALEADAGVADRVSAQLDLDQAEEDMRRAQARAAEAREKLREFAARDGRPAFEVVRDYLMEEAR
jgi:hypothetical protein